MPICLYNGAIVLEYGTDTLLYSNYIDIDAVYSLINRIIQLEVAIYIYTFSIDNIGLIDEGKSRIQEKYMEWEQKQIRKILITWWFTS